MNVLAFLTNYWSQITVLLGVIGVLVKIILDFNIRKSEIKFEHLYKEKASAFQEFFISYREFESLLTIQSFQYKYGNMELAEYDRNMNSAKEALNKKINMLEIFCTTKEREGLYAVLNSCTYIVLEIKNIVGTDIDDALMKFRKDAKNNMEKISGKFIL